LPDLRAKVSGQIKGLGYSAARDSAIDMNSKGVRVRRTDHGLLVIVDMNPEIQDRQENDQECHGHTVKEPGDPYISFSQCPTFATWGVDLR